MTIQVFPSAMPFPLAHPAAVLPLRRYCPRFLSLPALVIGSLAPDAGYLLGRWNVENLSHTFLGSLEFSLPLGVAVSYLFFALRLPMVRLLPRQKRKPFLALCQRPMPNPIVIVISVLLGAWTHLLLDSVTHQNGWYVEQIASLHAPIAMFGHRTLRVCHLLWYGASFAGVAWLFYLYEKWRLAGGISEATGPARGNLVKALIVGMLTLPIEAVHHLVHSMAGVGLVGTMSFLLVAGVALGIGDKIRFSTMPRA